MPDFLPNNFISSKKLFKGNLGTISPSICSFFARFPPFRRKTGALALRQQVFFTHQQVAERGQQV